MSMFDQITDLPALCRKHNLNHLILNDEGEESVCLTEDPNITICNLDWDFLDTLGYIGCRQSKDAAEIQLVRHNPTNTLHLLKDKILFN